MLSIVVKDNVAALDYLDIGDGPGFQSIGNLPDIDRNGSTTFSISHNQADDLEIPNESLVPFSVAVEAAREFFRSSQRPKCLDWLEI